MIKTTIIGIVAIALILFVLAGSSSFQYCLQQHQHYTSDSSFYDNIAVFGRSFGAYRGCTGSFVHEKGGDILTCFTIVLAFSTLLLWVATRDLANEAGLSSRLELRAYVGIGHPKFGKPDPDAVEITIENGGRTPAYNITGWMNTHWILGASSLLPDDFTFPDKEQGASFLVYRSTSMLHPQKAVQYAFMIDFSLIDRCRKKEIALFFYGHVNYIDIFRKPHTTTFCYQYFPVDVGIGHRLVMWDEHNEAT
jgi:hypothetical protein